MTTSTPDYSRADGPFRWDPQEFAAMLHRLDALPSLFCVRRKLRDMRSCGVTDCLAGELLAEQVERRKAGANA